MVVDDERPARQRIEDLLNKEPDLEVIGSYGDGREAAEAIIDDEPDLVFLDVQMPEVTGIDIVQRVGPRQMPTVIFVTAYDQYALKAFDLYALDYLLKPFDDERFHQALGRAREHIRLRKVDQLSDQLVGLLQGTQGRSPTSASAAPLKYLDRIAVKTRDQTLFIPVQEVDYISADGPYATLHVGKKTHLIRERMHVLEEQLDPDQFVRIHRSTIVNLERVLALEPYFRGDYVVKLKDGTQIKLSRGRREGLERRLGLTR